MSWLYISLVDETKPTGNQFVGAAYIPPHNDELLRFNSWALRGKDIPHFTEAAIVIVPDDMVPADHKYHGRILTKEELQEAHPCSYYGDMAKRAGAK